METSCPESHSALMFRKENKREALMFPYLQKMKLHKHCYWLYSRTSSHIKDGASQNSCFNSCFLKGNAVSQEEAPSSLFKSKPLWDGNGRFDLTMEVHHFKAEQHFYADRESASNTPRSRRINTKSYLLFIKKGLSFTVCITTHLSVLISKHRFSG